MMSTGYFPETDKEFHGWVRNFVIQVVANASRWKIPALALTILQAVNVAYIYAWLSYFHPERGKTENQEFITNHNEAMNDLKRTVRNFIDRELRPNPAVTESDYELLGIPAEAIINVPQHN
jgi:hypothetical protein